MFKRIRWSRWRGVLVAAAVLAGGLMVVPSAQADILGFKNGAHWVVNHANIGSGNPPVITGTSCQITDDISDEHNTAWYENPQFITAFSATFTFTVSGNKAADGAAFVIHNDPAGVDAFGTQNGGSGLGLQGMQNWAAIAFDVYSSQNPAHPGTGHFGETDFLYNDGGANVKNPGGTYLDTTPLEITGGDTIQVTLTYDHTSMNLVQTMVDMTTGDTFTNTYPGVDIPALVGGMNTAFVGFSGGTGGASAIQTFANFTFIEMPEPSSAALAAVGIVGALMYCWRRRSQARA